MEQVTLVWIGGVCAVGTVVWIVLMLSAFLVRVVSQIKRNWEDDE